MTLQVINRISTEFNLPDFAEWALNSSSQETCLYHRMSKNKQYSRQDNYQMWCKVDCLVSIWCFCRKVCEYVKSDHTGLGIPWCRQLSLSEKDLFNQSNIVLSENCQVSSYPQMLLVQSERVIGGQVRSRSVKWNNSCIMFSSNTGSVGYGLLQDIFTVKQAGSVSCYASVNHNQSVYLHPLHVVYLEW